MNLRKIILTVSVALTAATMLSAQEQRPLWMRYPAISPDGKQIAFSYQGDLFSVTTQGGTARRLTTSEGYDYRPMWSPDGSKLAFVSTRTDGREDIYVMDARGGQAKRVTTHSTSETPISWSRDGKYILYAAHIQDPASSALFPARYYNELYRIPAEGGRTELVMPTPLSAGVLLPDGSGLIYEDHKGMENEWRKHHTSSVTRDLIRYDFKSQKYTPIVTWKGEDRNPVLSADGRTLYFLSERGAKSCFNVFSATIDGQNVKQLTSYTDHPVRFLSSAADGTLCYGYDGEIYTMRAGGQPQRVQVSILSDYVEEPEQEIALRSGITSASISPDGKQVAFVIRGEVFVTSADYTTTKRITNTPAAESSVTFGDDRTIVYASERNGKSDLYVATIKRSDDPDFPHSTLIDEKLFIPGDKSEKTCPQFAPNGKDLAYLKDRSRLVIYNTETKKEREITDGRYQVERDGQIDFTWSPDSKWIAMSIVDNGHNPYYDVALVSATEAKPVIHNLTQSGYFAMSPRFVMDGNAIIYTSEQYGMRNHASWGSMNDVMIVFLNRESYDKFVLDEEEYKLLSEAEKKAKEQEKEQAKKDEKKAEKKDDTTKDIRVELDNIDHRILRLTPVSSELGDAFITSDGETLYYMSAFEGGYDLWKKDLRKGDVELLKKLDGPYYNFMPDRKGDKIFMIGSRDMKKMSLPGEKIESVSYEARMKLRPADERRFEYDYVRREEGERIFYEDITNINGANWPELTDHYEKFLPYITNDQDFSDMLSELLGELNVSHTGSGYRGPVSSPSTAELGLFLDWTPSDKGLKIDEVVIGGPFDTFRSKVEAGDYITAIDGEEIDAKTDYFPLLRGKVGRETLISLYCPKSGARWEETIKPISSGKLRDLLYKRWVSQRAEEVRELSDGKLGYVHIPSMDDESFRKVYSDALGKYYNCDGIVIDIRCNGGGRLHEDIEVLFTGTKYLEQMTKGRDYCPMPSRRWTKPSVMVTCEADYSNAHGTPWVYQTMKIGKIVGMPVPGTMSSVNWITLQNPAIYFGVPAIGYMTKEGYYLENHQVEPDVKQPMDFTEALQGRDTQLKRAVEVLRSEMK